MKFKFLKKAVAFVTAVTMSLGMVMPENAMIIANAATVINSDGTVSYNGHRYKIYNKVASTYSEAMEYCEVYGGHLATISDANENQFLYNLMIDNNYSECYFGYNDIEQEGTFKWITGELSTYEKWAGGEPNNYNGNEDHVSFNSGKGAYVWNDNTFNNSPFICEWDSDETILPPQLGTIHIKSPDDLVNLSKKNVLYNGYANTVISIDADIDMTGMTWTPLGTEFIPFKGSIEGNGYTISNLKVAATSDYLTYGGLIGYAEVTDNMSIKNLNIANYNYNTYQDEEAFGAVLIAGLSIKNDADLNIDNLNLSGAGWAQSTWGNGFYGNVIGKVVADSNTNINISNIITKVRHDGYSMSYGVDAGIVGHYQGTDATSKLNISKCHVSDDVLAFSFFGYCSADGGGIIGALKNGNATVSECCVNGKLRAKSYYTHLGGIVGNVDNSIISINNCLVNPNQLFETSQVSFLAECNNGQAGLGGFIGCVSNASGSEINNSFFSSTTQASVKAGFAAFCSADQLTVNNSYFDIDTTGIKKNDCVVELGMLHTEWIKTGLNNSYGLTTSQIGNKNSYNSWDFDNVWAMSEEGYPILRWMYNGFVSGDLDYSYFTKEDLEIMDYINQHYAAASNRIWDDCDFASQIMHNVEDDTLLEAFNLLWEGVLVSTEIVNTELFDLNERIQANDYNALMIDMFTTVDAQDRVNDMWDKSVLTSANDLSKSLKLMLEYGELLLDKEDLDIINNELDTHMASFKALYSSNKDIALERYIENVGKTLTKYDIKLDKCTNDVLTKSVYTIFGDLKSITGDISTFFSSTVKFIDSMDNIISAQSYIHMTDTYKQLLIELRDEARKYEGNSKEKNDIISAINYAIYYQEYQAGFEVVEQLLLSSAEISTSKLIEETTEYGIEEFLKGTFDLSTAKISDFMLYWKAAQISSKAGVFISDCIFDTSKQTELYSKIKKYGTLQILVRRLTEKKASNLLQSDISVSESYNNAVMFDKAFKMYKFTEIDGCRNIAEYERTFKIDNFIKQALTVNKHLSEQAIKHAENAVSLDAYADSTERNIYCHLDWDISQDDAEYIINEYFKAHKVAIISCPVKVNVYDTNKNLVGSLSKEKTEIDENHNIFMFRIESTDSSVVSIPKDYSIEIVGLNEGTMTVFSGYYENNTLLNHATYYDVPVDDNYSAILDITSDDDMLLDNNSKLSVIKINDIELTEFEKDTTAYNYSLDEDTTEIPTVTATPSNANANVSITQATSLTGTEAERTATITVIAEDGVTKTVYTVIFSIEAHEHDLAEEWTYDETGHWKKCSKCDDKVDFAEHIYDKEIVSEDTLKSEATTESEVVYYKSCECGAISTSDTFTEGEKLHAHTWSTDWSKNETHHWHECTAENCDVIDNADKDGYATHVYNKAIANEDTLKSEATTESEAVYYKSCECGAISTTETFTDGEKLHAHAWSTDWSKNETHHWHECTAENCDVVDNADKDGYAAHVEDEGKITTEPTETTEGIMTFCCKFCGYEIRTEPVDKLEHNHNTSSDWTCDGTGHWHICSGCDEKVEFTTHTENNGEVTVQPTETTEGEMTYSCTVCGYITRKEAIDKLEHIHISSTEWSSDATGHWNACSGCDEKLNFSTHNEDEGTVTNEPTEETEGEKVYKCIDCGYTTRTEILAKLAHTHNQDSVLMNDATGHWYNCTSCDEKLDFATHTEDGGTVTTAPTETTEGEMTYKCTVCGYVTRTEPIDKLEHIHVPSTEWTFDATGHWHICSGCDDKIDFSTHSEDSGTITTYPTETTEGEKTYACTVCGYVTRTETIPVITPEHKHSFSKWGYNNKSHWLECRCGEKSELEEEHISDNGNIVGGSKVYSCIVCGCVLRVENSGENNAVITPPASDTYVNSSVFPSTINPRQKLEVDVITDNDTVTLKWNKINNAKNYTVYQLKNGRYVKIKDMLKTSITFRNLKNGQTYKFMVRYTANGQLSPKYYSGKATVTICIDKPVVKATSAENSIKLEWSKVDGAEKYAVYKYVNGKAVKLIETKKTSVKINKLAPKTKYQYIVRAYINGKWTTMTKSDIVTATTK